VFGSVSRSLAGGAVGNLAGDGQRVDSPARHRGCMTTGPQRLALQIPQGLCRRCVRALSRRLRDLPGVAAFEIDASGGRVWVSGDVEASAAEGAVRDLSCP
jgi:ribosomal protein S14